jgi:tetratricopeptide (TPR) repeat protein
MAEQHQDSHNRQTASWTRFLPGIFLVLATMAVFWPVFGHQFLAYDDPVDVYNNPYLQQASLENLIHFWRYPYEGLYTPLTYTLFALVAWAPSLLPSAPPAGIAPDPLLFHSLSLFLHLLSVLSVWRIARLILSRTRPTETPIAVKVDAMPLEWAACGGALLFAIHPIQVEPVAWVAGFKDVLCGLLSLTAVWHYLLYADAKPESRPWLHYWIATGAFVLALLAKPTAVVVPMIVWLLAAWCWRRSTREQIASLLVWFLIALAWGLLTRWVQPGTSLDFKPPLWARPLIAGDAIVFYFYKLVIPLEFGPDYGRTPEFVLEHGWLFLTGLLPWVLAVWIGLKRRRLPWLAASSGIFVVGLLPVLGLISFSFQHYSTVADRYVYLAMLGPALALAWGLTWPKKYFAAVGGAILLGLFLLRSVIQIPYWQNNETFFEHALKINSDSSFSHNNLGRVHAKYGRQVEAIHHYTEALRLEPKFPVAHLNLGNALASQGKYPEAMQHYAEAIRLVPVYARAHTNMGIALAAQGRFDEALAAHRKALRLEPGFAEAYNNLGKVLMRQGKLQEARKNFTKALQLQPRNAGAHINLGISFAMQKRFDEALPHFSEALGLDPTSAQAHYNLAGVLLQQGKIKEAEHHYSETIRLRPDYLKAHLRLSIVLANQGKFPEAIHHTSEALRINPDHRVARQLLERLQHANKSSSSSN